MALKKRGLDSLVRIADQLGKNRLLTPAFEHSILKADWPEEYQIKVYNKERKWDGYFHPSTDIEPGALFLYYRFHPDYSLEYERPTPQLEMTFQVGNAFHSLVQSMLVHMDMTSEDECEVGWVKKERWASGTTDVKYVYLPNSKRYPLEIKSCAFPPKEPYKNHVKQLNIYMDCAYDEPEEEGIIFYIEKSHPHRMVDFLIRRDQELLNEIYYKWDSVLYAIAEDDPESLRDCCMPNSKEHRQCPARNVCRIGPPKPKT